LANFQAQKGLSFLAPLILMELIENINTFLLICWIFFTEILKNFRAIQGLVFVGFHKISHFYL